MLSSSWNSHVQCTTEQVLLLLPQAIEACDQAEARLSELNDAHSSIALLTMRALAYEQLEMFEPGAADFERVLRLDPVNHLVSFCCAANLSHLNIAHACKPQCCPDGNYRL